MIVLQQMLIFFIVMLVGIEARRQGLITPANQKQLSGLVVNLACPALILSGAFNEGEKVRGSEFFVALAVALGVFAVMLVVSRVLPRLFHYPVQQQNTVSLFLVFTNMAFMGIPLLEGIFGKAALIYMTVFMIPSNVLFFTYGMQTMRRGQPGDGKSLIFRLLNPGVVASLVSIVLYFAPFKLPAFLITSINMVGSVTAPLSMMLIGSTFADFKWRELYGDKRLIWYSLLKMIVFPVLFLLILKQFIHNEYLLGACLVVIATPVASMVAMIAALYNPDSYLLTAKAIAFTTLISVLTLPLVALLTDTG